MVFTPSERYGVLCFSIVGISSIMPAIGPVPTIRYHPPRSASWSVWCKRGRCLEGIYLFCVSTCVTSINRRMYTIQIVCQRTFGTGIIITLNRWVRHSSTTGSPGLPIHPNNTTTLRDRARLTQGARIRFKKALETGWRRARTMTVGDIYRGRTRPVLSEKLCSR